MKKNILLLVLIVFFCSCNNKSSGKTEPEKSKSETKSESYYELVNIILENDAEKIALLSLIKNIPYVQMNSILRDYLASTYYSTLSTMENPESILTIVDTIAQKNNLSKKLTASIIFSYQFEMITRDEITESYQDEMMDYQNEMDQY